MPCSMSHRARRERRGRTAAALALAAGAALLAGCGTPAVVKPAQDPLPGFQRDIHAAQGVVAQSQREAQDFGSTSAPAP
jgi:uncharacterized lipoprotein YajG